MDEFQYWGDMARSDERASQFVDLFKPISKEFGGLDTMDMQDVMELVDIAQDTLDDVWKCLDFDAYPEPRMKHLMDIIGMMFLSCYHLYTQGCHSGYLRKPKNTMLPIYTKHAFCKLFKSIEFNYPMRKFT